VRDAPRGDPEPPLIGNTPASAVEFGAGRYRTRPRPGLRPDGAEALGDVRHREHGPRVRVEQRLDVLEHGATLVLGEHGALASRADELDEVGSPEQLDVDERRVLDRPVDTALADARDGSVDATLAELAPTDT
jgi:hypothetical protein